MIKFCRQNTCAQRMLGSGVNNFGFRGRMCFNFIASCSANETNLDHCLNYQLITSIMPTLCFLTLQ